MIRTADLVTRTAIQFDMFAALGVDPRPLGVAHLLALTEPGAERSSKRLERLTLRSLRNDGIEAASLATCLARPGMQDKRPAPMRELAQGFDFAHFAAGFDARHLLALNRRALEDLPFAAVANRLSTTAVHQAVAQGIVPPAPHALLASVTHASYLSFLDGLHKAMLISAIVSFAGAALALLVQRGHEVDGAAAAA